ncbi:MAG TPA: hypothetical protein VKU00_04475 [Chthonomonadaceae bacterium]|nr:hypothetical protein [Chthonomonadaceae bacterium]
MEPTDQHPFTRPIAYVIIVLVFTLIGGIWGFFGAFYGIRGMVIALSGGILGCGFGVFIAILWGLFCKLGNL